MAPEDGVGEVVKDKGGRDSLPDREGVEVAEGVGDGDTPGVIVGCLLGVGVKEGLSEGTTDTAEQSL